MFSYLSPYYLLLLLITILSIALQCYVLFLIWHTSPSSMREYRYFLSLFTIVDLLFTIAIGLGLKPAVIYPMSGVVVDGLFALLGQDLSNYAVASIYHLGAVMVAVEVYCMFYRWTVISQRQGVHKFIVSKGGKSVGLLLLFSIGLIYSVPLPSIYTEGQLVIPQQSSHSVHFSVLNDSRIITCFVDTYSGEVWAHSLLLAGGILLAEGLSIWMAVAIFVTLSRNSGAMTAKTLKMHKQLTLLLMGQLLSPVAFIALPMFGALLWGVFLKRPAGEFMSHACFGLLEMYASVNSLLTLSITPYRRHFMGWLKSDTDPQ